MLKKKIKKVKSSALDNLPIILSLLIFLISIFYNDGVLNSETRILNQENDLVLNHFGNELKKSFIDVTKHVKDSFLFQWNNLNNYSDLFSYNWFIEFMPLFYNYFDTLYSISWLNEAGFINWSYPNQTDFSLIGNNTSLNNAFLNAKNTNMTVFSETFLISESKIGMESFTPVYYQGNLSGVFGIVFDMDIIINNIIQQNDIIKGYSLQVFDNDRQMAVVNGNFSLENTYVLANTVSFHNKELKVYSKPLDETILKISPYNMLPIFVAEIILCFITYYLTNLLKTKNKLIENDREILYHKKKFESLGTLSGGIAHDFNNIITNINGQLELIVHNFFPILKNTDMSDKDKESFIRNINALFRNTKRAKEITNQILIFSKQAQISMQYVELSQTLENSIRFVQETNDRKIIFEFNRLDLAYVYTNETLLEQIFMNILINSVNAVKKQQNPRIKIEMLKIEDIDKIFNNDIIKQIKEDHPDINMLGSGCIIKITDNGKGMSPELIKKAIDPISTVTTSKKGTGLGLRIIQNNISLMGGDFDIESKENEFTTIKIILPLVKPKMDTVIKKKLIVNIDSLALKDFNICIIDDEIDIADSYSKILTTYGSRTVYYTKSRDFLIFYESNVNYFDLLVIDYNMPEMNGLKLLLEIQKLNKDQKVILMTGYVTKELENIKIPLITKPFEVHNLITIIKNLLQLI